MSGSVAEDTLGAENPTENNAESTDTEMLAEDLEASQTDDQTGDITESILEAAAETERLEEEEVKGSPVADEQTDIIVEAEDSVDAENPTERIGDAKTVDQSGDVSEDADVIESSLEKTEDTPSGEDIEAVAAAEKPAEEVVEGVQAEDEQADTVVEAGDSNPEESLIQEAEETQTDELTDDVSESTAEEMVTEDSSESKSIVDRIKELLSGKGKPIADRIKKRLSGRFSIGSKSGDSSEEGTKAHAETENLIEETDDIHTDVQDENVVETVTEYPEPVEDFTEKVDDTLNDEQVDGAEEEDVKSSVVVIDHTAETDNQDILAKETDVEDIDDEVQTAVYNESKPPRTKKTGIIISVFIVIAAVILLLVASVERRSAKEALVQVSKVAESIKQMRGETLKDREQVIHSQIEGRELVIDALSLTRNGLELERANSDEVEVKRIIGVFISDIDERITKIKGNIDLLRNKLKETD